MFSNKKRNYAIKILSVTFALVISLSIFGQIAPYKADASRFSFVGEDSNVSSSIKLNGKDTGAIYTRIHLGSGGSAGWGANRYINIVEANLEQNPNLSFEVINNGTYIKNAVPLTTEVNNYKEDDKKILAAVNGDWMSWSNSVNASVKPDYRVTFSPLVLDGEIWCSQMTVMEQAADYYTMCITSDNKVAIGKPTVLTKITNVTTDKTATATGFNRAPANNTLTVYNNRLNDSNYVSTDAYEVVVKADSSSRFYSGQAVTGTVTKIYPAGTTSRAGLDDDTIILTARGNKIKNLDGKYSVGDKVSITATLKCTTNKDYWEKCEEAIGGQCLVMKNGVINNDLSGAGTEQYPTSIIGYKKDGTVMMTMVTADTHGKYVGLNFKKDIADFCKEIGYDTCFLFDGGGSTTMITLDDGGKFVERACYADGEIRSVWNSLALVYDPTPEAPATPTKAPTTPSKEPTTPSKAPTTPSKEPTTPSKAPTTPTKEPEVVPTQVPTETATAEPTTVATESPTTSTETLTPTKEATQIPSTATTEVNDNKDNDSNTGVIIAVSAAGIVIIAAIAVLIIFLKKK